ncbi:D-lactaldehyde dehydrogenase [Dacryopinax primogenitus]|uniref:D-lactaldehyde dehydrogenase n=1 Tax=Dacryopinax primogenitus (strain DJM 731) TaxID=1858805 RepID=M5FQC9_DACPD|nr:D-lactaldehyde dehydrogenase [Dacryopinax primogenitus]EJT96899.1 D-lactaldehyde dehydrogenase [Dacryopinax primogenitus]
MTVVNAPATVLVTGANGYIGVWICRILLENGYSVRGTVRAASKGDYLKKLFEKEGERFEYVIVKDITVDGAFDEAVKGVHAVVHTASPVTLKPQHPDALIKPAVIGTLSVLTSVDKYGADVGRVVMTSSSATFVEPHKDGYVYTEKDWNEYSVREVEEKGDKAAPMHVYRASKTLAERKAWDVEKEKKGNWDLVTILPPYVFGPLLQEVAGKDSLNASVQILYDAVLTPMTGEVLYQFMGSWVDVRDVALAHALALQKEEAGGERIIVSAGQLTWQDVYDALSSPSLDPPFPNAPKGTPSAQRKGMQFYSTEFCNKLFGIQFKGLGESARDTMFSVWDRD